MWALAVVSDYQLALGGSETVKLWALGVVVESVSVE